jgi:hypothetical protein
MQQTNTSEMLDIAVDYIKVLQEQIEVCSTQAQLLYFTHLQVLKKCHFPWHINMFPSFST